VAQRVPPTESQLAAAVDAASARTVTAYVDADAGRALMEHAPAKGAIVKTTLKGNVTEWTLSNGATVALLPTTLKADQILFLATAPGGTSLASDADFFSARIADDVIPAGGVGDLSQTSLDKLLNGKSLAVQPFINETREGLGGGSVPRDVETMFQLIYQRFTAPRADPTAFAGMKARALAALADQSASPDVLFNQTLAAALSGNHLRRQPETPATVAKWNLDTSLAFYKARFADASNYTFVFVGSFTLDDMRPLVETYIASLPATRAHERWRDVGVKPPAGVVQTTVRKGIAPKSEVAIVFSGPFEFTPQNQLALQTATLLLQGRLSEALREELGATYAISADSETSRYPQPEYRVSIHWTCDPAQVDKLVARVFQEVAAVRDTPIGADQMTRIRAYHQRELERLSQDNGYLLRQILQRYETGEPIDRDVVSENAAQIAALTGEAITRAAVRYFDPARYVRVTLMPDTAK
jgi:zinc protease